MRASSLPLRTVNRSIRCGWKCSPTTAAPGSLVVGDQLLQPFDASGDYPRPAEEQVSVLKFENVEAAKRRPYLFLRSERHTVGVHGPDDVLQVVLANIDEVEGEPIASLRIDCFRDTQPARVGQSFQARRDVHAVAHEIVTVDDDITKTASDQALGYRRSACRVRTGPRSRTAQPLSGLQTQR